MNISEGERERESGLQLFVDGLSFQLYLFPFMFLFFPLWKLFRPKMVTDTRIIERCNKKREPASSLTQFFFPIQHMGLGTLAMWPCLKISSSDFFVFFLREKISNFETYPPGVAKLCCKITWQQILSEK